LLGRSPPRPRVPSHPAGGGARGGSRSGGASSPRSAAASSPSGRRAASSAAAVEAERRLLAAFHAAPRADRVSLGDAGALPLAASELSRAARARVQVHRLIYDDGCTVDFDTEVDADDGGVWLLPAAVAAVGGAAAPPPRGASLFAVLSTDAGVVAAAHAFMRLKASNMGCCARALSALPADTPLLVVFDHVTLADEAGVAVIVHATAAPTARTRLAAFLAALDAWPAANCHVEGRASVGGSDADGDDASDAWAGAGDWGDEADDGVGDGAGDGARETVGDAAGDAAGDADEAAARAVPRTLRDGSAERARGVARRKLLAHARPDSAEARGASNGAPQGGSPEGAGLGGA